MPDIGGVMQLDDVGFSLDGSEWHWYHKVEETTPGRAQPVTRADTGPGEDLPRPQRSWHHGSGQSRLASDAAVADRIDYCWPADNRRERSILPPPKLEELPMPVEVTGRWTATFEQEWVTGTPQPADFFALVDHYCLRLTTGQSVPVIDAFFSALFTPLSAVNFGGPVYVGGDGLSLFRREAGGTWRQSSDFFPATPVQRRHLALAKVRRGQEFAEGSGTAGQERLTLFGSLYPPSGSFKWCSGDPLNPGDWYPGTAPSLGLSNNAITYMFSAPSAVAFLKPEGVFLHNGTSSMHLTPYWASDLDIYNAGVWGMFYRNGMLASHPRYLDFVPYSFSFQQAPRKVWPIPGNTSPVQGQVTAGTIVDGEPMLAVYIESLNQSAICAGAPADLVGAEGGVSPLVWYFALQIIPGRVDVMAVTSRPPIGGESVPYVHCLASNAPGLSSLDTTLKSRWFRFRIAKGGNPLMDDTYPFATYWTAYATEDDLGEEFAGTQATTRRAAVVAGGGDFGVFSVSADGGAYVEQGQVSSPGSSWRAPTQVSGRRFKWKFEGYGYEDDPYELQSFTPHYILSPDEIERDVHQLILTPRLTTGDGTVVDVDVAAEEQFIRYIQKQGDVHYMDPTGQEWLGKVVPGRQRMLVKTDDDWGVILTVGVDRIAMIRYWGRGPRYGDGSEI